MTRATTQDCSWYTPSVPVPTDDVVRRYGRERDLYEKLAREVFERCREIMQDNAIRATYQWRFKDEARLAGKIERRKSDLANTIPPTAEPGTVEAWMADLTDLAAVRVLTYEESARESAASLIAEKFLDKDGLAPPRPDVRNKVDQEKGKFYRATHLLVTLPTDDFTDARLSNLKGVVCEIQVCSLLAHVWNEIEHDLVYKQLSGTPNETEINLLRALGNETLAGDAVISELIKATGTRTRALTDKFIDVHDFVSRARDAFPSASRFSDNAGQLFAELLSLGVDNMQKLNEMLGDDMESRAKASLHALDAGLDTGDQESLKLSDATSDLALILVLETKAQAIIDAHPAGRGVGRPPRIASIARRFLQVNGVKAAE